MAINTESFDFDPDYLRKKYREERDKRLRQDGNEQYQEVSGEFSYFVEDPYVDDAIEREAIKDEIEVVIIGGGFGGMLAGARLREAGIDDFKIIEKGGGHEQAAGFTLKIKNLSILKKILTAYLLIRKPESFIPTLKSYRRYNMFTHSYGFFSCEVK